MAVGEVEAEKVLLLLGEHHEVHHVLAPADIQGGIDISLQFINLRP